MFTNKELMEHERRLKNFSYKLTQNTHDAEDLYQSAVLRALEKRDMYKENTNLYGWVSKIMYNLFVTGYRRKVKFQTQYDPESYIEKQSVGPKQDIDMEIQDVDNAMNELSTDHQNILVMVCVKGMQYADVAERLHIPVGTVRSRLSRARENLQAEMHKVKQPAYAAAMKGASSNGADQMMAA